MNIDLFLTGQSEAALVCGGTFAADVAGIILDAQTKELTLEFVDQTTAHLNIPVEESRIEKMLFAHRMYVGYLDNGLLADSFEAPLYYLNDPYGSEFGQTSPLSRARRSILAFEQFMKRCSFAQAVHRDNLGDEATARSVLYGADPAALNYTPALARQMQMQAAPKVRTAPVATPNLGGGTRQARTALTRKETGEDSE